MADDPTDDSRVKSQFAAQSTTAEDLLKSQTVGLVHLSDFRKRRAEVLEQKEREAQDKLRLGTASPNTVSTSQNGGTPSQRPLKKNKKSSAKVTLSFGVDDDNETESNVSSSETPRSSTPATLTGTATPNEENAEVDVHQQSRRLGPNTTIKNAPMAMTKTAQAKVAQAREQLRKEFLILQEAVKATEIAIPFVFYDGTNIPGGVCKIKKGDHIWLFLDKSRKVGAELGVGGVDKSRREWARVGVDDLMLVRGEIIIPHHYEFYYFIVNKTRGFNGPLFPFSTEATAMTPATQASQAIDLKNYNPLSRPGEKKTDKVSITNDNLEGSHDDPGITKVVDRRWYEKNKHIFPASSWEEFDPTKDYTKGIRKDTEGNTFFFS